MDLLFINSKVWGGARWEVPPPPPLIYDPLVTLDFLRPWFSLRNKKKARTYSPLTASQTYSEPIGKERGLSIALDRMLAYASLAVNAVSVADCLFSCLEPTEQYKGREMRRNMYMYMIYIHEWRRSLISQFSHVFWRCVATNGLRISSGVLRDFCVYPS
jgi:hypothetical protein